MSRRVLTANLDCSFETRDRFVDAALLEQDDAEIVFSNIVVVSHSECVCPERFAVTPVGRLQPGAPGKRDDDRGRADLQDFPLVTPLAC